VLRHLPRAARVLEMALLLAQMMEQEWTRWVMVRLPSPQALHRVQVPELVQLAQSLLRVSVSVRAA